METIQIFLASSSELRTDREAFEQHLSRQNERWHKRDIHFKVVHWEDHDDTVSKTRKQDDYNESLKQCDLLVVLYWTKVGKYTSEEFEAGYTKFQDTGTPHIFVYEKTEPYRPGSRQDTESKHNFCDRLKEIEHFPTQYQHSAELIQQFNTRLTDRYDVAAAAPIATTNPIYLSPTRQPPLAAHLVLGRQKDLDAIAEHLRQGDHLLLLHGMGGVGKSTLAGCYMERSASGYRHIAWVNYTGSFAADCVREVNDYATLGFEPEGNTEAQFEQLLRAMDRLPVPNLLVVDNLNTLADVEDAANCARRLPPGWKVLLTAREHDDRFPRHDVGVLALPDARELFLRHRPLKPVEKQEELDALLELVGRHTLVVELLAKTTAGQGWTLDKMQQRLLAEGLTRLDTKVEVGAAHSHHQRQRMAAYVSALFDINLTQLSEEECWLLAQVSMLPAWAHPCSLLEEMFAKKEGMDADTLHPLLHGLTEKGLLEKQTARRPAHPLLEAEAAEEDGFYMHPVLQEVVREKEQPDCERCEEMVEFFIDKYSDGGDGSRNLALALPWLSYGDALAAHLPDHERTGALANNLSQIHKAKGDLDKALEWQLKDIAIGEKKLEENHPSLAISYSNLSIIHLFKGNHDVALDWQLKAVAIQETALKKNHPSWATLYNALSLIHKAKGNIDKALEWQLKAIAIQEKTSGENYPWLATSYNNISGIYRTKGDLDKALEWQLKAIVIQVKALGENHPNLAASYNNISVIHHAKGDLDSALEWQLKAIAIWKKALGENHPDLAISLVNLAGIYDGMNEPVLALPLLQSAVDIFKQRFPQGHPNLNVALWWLGRIERKIAAQEK